MTDETILALLTRNEDLLVTLIENFYDFKKDVTERLNRVEEQLNEIRAEAAADRAKMGTVQDALRKSSRVLAVI